MNTISVIVPVFYGKPYIDGLVKQIEAAAERLGKEDRVELLLVNDAPDDPLPQMCHSGRIEIIVLNTTRNRGIQGARVRGVKNSCGDYLLFLDQDDKIEPEYFSSQLACIGKEDAVICQVFHENKPFYNIDYPFEKAFSKEFMLHNGNPIISPGQVLIKRDSISAVWMENIMEHNGADDFLLWLCMVGEGKTFARNEKIVFSHIVMYNNNSWNTVEMLESEREMESIIKQNHVFEKQDEALLEQMVERIYKKRLKNLDKFRKMFYILNDWKCLAESGKSISDYLIGKNIRRVAIYGVGYLGKHLIREFKSSKIELCYLIDRNAAWLETEYAAYTLKDPLDAVDLVIVTLVQDEQEVVKVLHAKLEAEVITIMTLIQNMGKGG